MQFIMNMALTAFQDLKPFYQHLLWRAREFHGVNYLKLEKNLHH